MHRLLIFGTGLLVIVSCLLTGVVWRLAQGPIDLGWLGGRVRTALVDDAAGERVSFDGLALTWEGFDRGVDHPLDLRVSNITIVDPAGRSLLAAPDAHITLSFAGLLLGRLVPRSIEVDHGRVTVTREASGAVNLGWGQDSPERGDAGGFDLGPFWQQLVHPASSDHGRSHGLLDQIRRAHFRDTALTFRDRESGLTVHASNMDVDLVRAATGAIRGSVQGRLAVGGEQSLVAGEGNLLPGGGSSLRVQLTPFRPAAIAGLPPALAFLADVDVPVSITSTVGIDAGFGSPHVRVAATFGAGRIRIGQGDIPLRSGAIALSGTTDEVVISNGHVDLAHAAGDAPEDISFSGSITRASDRLTASVTVGLDQLDIADLPRLLPAGVGSDARAWVTEHVTGGMAGAGTASFVIEADEALHDVALTKAVADLDGSNASFTWLDNMPPVEQAEVHLHLADPDTLDIHLTSGHQRIGTHGVDLVIKDSTMRITGLSFPDQAAKIHTQVEGPVISALGLLSEPRLHLLSAHPIGLVPTGGEVSAVLDFQFPLVDSLRIDDVRIRTSARLTHVHVANVVGGQDLDDGGFDLNVDKDGLGLKGHGSLAKVPVTLDGTMNFNLGASDQIVQKIALTGRPDAAQIDAAGLHVTDVVSGPIPVTATLIERRGGDGSISIGGDLTQARLEVGALAWSKPSGGIASATATLLLSHDRPTKIGNIVVRGDGVAVNGSASFIDGHLRTVQLDTIQLGRTQGHGTIHIGGPDEIGIVIQGGQIDLSAKLTQKSTAVDVPRGAPVTTPAWRLDARFDHAILANGETARDVLANVTGAGDGISLLDAVGKTQGGIDFSAKIEPWAGKIEARTGKIGPNPGKTEPQPGKRHLAVDAKDAGRFLRGMDAIRGMQSGHLAIDGVFDAPTGLHPLAGTAVIDHVVVRNSPALGKLLQAITLYGLVDVLRGPGITFSRIVAPFQYDGANLVLNEARAANPSLGLTAKGRVGLSAGQISISGTIVPAYFFNSMLGQLPLIGRLFSPEKGGGVFAARFGIEGSIDDPSISINPVSALTPGFLRDIFGIFDNVDAGASGGGPPKQP